MVKFGGREPGTYRATFVKLDTDFEMTDRETQETVTRWRWVFQDKNDPTTVGEMDTITSPSLNPRTNGLKFFTGMLGRPPTKEDDTDYLLGQEFDVTWGPNQAQRLTIVNVARPKETPVPTLPAAATSTASDGPLPF